MEQKVKPNSPLVSIAMATYNGAAFIEEQLNSILAQTVANFEIIIVDDCSTDGTLALIKTYQSKDNRIQLFENTANKGYRTTFYKALQHCKGDYLLFCDQDDVWMLNKLETLLGAIGDHLLIFSDSELMGEQGSRMHIKLSDTVSMLQPGETTVNRGFVIGNCVWGHTILFHKNLLNYLTPDHQLHPHDWWFAVVSSHLKKIKYCPEVLNYYRQHATNVTQAIPVKTGAGPTGKLAEFELQLSRIESIAALPYNKDRPFYLEWQRLFLQRKNGFSFSLFKFLLVHRRDVFSLKRKNAWTQLIEIRKMCRKTG